MKRCMTPGPGPGVPDSVHGLFTGRRLTTSTDMRRAFALVSIAYPHVSPARWFRVARCSMRLQPERGGVVVLQDRHGVMHALFRYRVAPSRLGGLGKTLRLDEIVTVQLPGNAALNALAACAQALAATLKCAAVSLDVPALDAPSLEGLQAAGFRHTAAVMVCTD